MPRRKFQKLADWQAASAKPVPVGPMLTVTACDRDGRVLERHTVARLTELEVIAERGGIHDRLREKFPDCQVYFDWERR